MSDGMSANKENIEEKIYFLLQELYEMGRYGLSIKAKFMVGRSKPGEACSQRSVER